MSKIIWKPVYLVVALALVLSFGAPGIALANTCPPGHYEETIFAEDFESWPPSGWTIVDNLGAGDVWESNATTGQPNYTGGAGYCADANSDWSYTAMDTELWTPPLDVSGYANVWLEFKTDYWNWWAHYDWAYVDVSSDGGSTWTNILSWNEDHRGPLTMTFDITPIVAGSTNMIVRWHYDTTGSPYLWWFQVDEVRIKSCMEFLPVGGEVYSVNKLAILAPWIALAAAIIAGASVLLRRRRAQT